jgi:hypothetical protein
VKPTICIAFEGIITEGYLGGDLLQDISVPGAMDALEALSRKFNLVIITASQPHKFSAITDWINRNKGSRYFLFEVTNIRPAAAYYIEKRAIKFDNWNNVMSLLGT